MLAPWPIRLSAHDLAFAALLFCVSQVLITNLWPAAPPLAFSCLTRIFAAASAGSSNGDLCPARRRLANRGHLPRLVDRPADHDRLLGTCRGLAAARCDECR